MATPVDLRCPKCGARLTAYTAYPSITSYTRCPHCASVLPFVAPREPAPLYSWEVYPGLYPPTPLPRPPNPRRRPALVVLLLASALLLVALGGVFAYVGGDALRPGSLTIGGQLSPSGAVGGWVDVQGENGFNVNESVPGDAFAVSGVPYGGVQIRAGAIGYGVLEVDLFLSPVYSSISGSPRNLDLNLNSQNGTSINIVDTTSFPNLESFVATVWSGTGILWIAAALVGIGLVAARRDRLPLVVLGGASAMISPFVLPLLGIDVVSEAVTAVALVAFPLGLAVLALTMPDFARAQPPVEPI
jgi:hypothetical protein